MSPRSGGEAAKFGDRFEGRWTVSWMLEVLRDKADAIVVETIDELRHTVEFEVQRDGCTERHQVKRQLGQAVNWTPKRLEDNEILDAALRNVSAGYDFWFVSTIPAIELEQLTDLAARSDHERAFSTSLRSVAQNVTGLRNRLVELWDKSLAEVFEIVRHIHAEKPSEEQLRRSNAAIAEVLVAGSGAATATTLGEIAGDKLSRTLTAAVIWQELARRDLQDLDATALRAAEATERWRRSVTREHLDPVIERAETATLFESLNLSQRAIVLLSGSAGSGKSGVAEQALANAKAAGWAAVGFRLDRQQLATTARQIGEQLDLPASPALTLAQAAQDNSVVERKVEIAIHYVRGSACTACSSRR